MIIDTDNYAAAGIKTQIFSGGEPHVEVPAFDGHVHIFAKLRTPADFMIFVSVLDALKRRDVEYHIFMPYLPGARQDREQEGFAFTCENYAAMLSLFMEGVTAVDVHSDEAVETYGRFMDVRTLRLGPIAKALIPAESAVGQNGTREMSRGRIAVLAPDKGAVVRAQEIARAIKCENVQFCTKKRDSRTGRIVTDVVPDFSSHTSHYEKILLGDDICDGGATFAGIAERLHKPAYNLHLELFVTHGIFSKGFAPLRRFRDIYTTNSFYQAGTQELFIQTGRQPGENETVRVHVIDLLPFYLESLTP